MRNVCRNHRRYTEMVFRRYALVDGASIWSFRQKLYHIRHKHERVVHEYANACALPNYHGTFYGNLYVDNL